MDGYFPTWDVMIAVDVLLIVLAIAGTGIVWVKWRELKLAGAKFGIVLLLTGLWVTAALYGADLFVMTFLPAQIGMERSMQAMQDLHLGYSWYLNSVSAVLILFGLSIVVLRLTAQLRAVDDARRLAEDESRQKTNFLATMSHELRTPLNAIIGFAQMLQILAPSDRGNRVREYSESIESSGILLNNLVNDLLDLSRIESGHLTLKMAEVDMCDIVTGAVRRLTGMARETGVELVAELEKPVFRCLADERAVEQIALNLLSNALKHTASGGTIRVSLGTPDTRNVRMTVADNGAGIAPELLPHVFEPFVHNDPMTQAGTSHGLGLPICKKLVEAHAGRIEIDSMPGVGTTVRVDLPLQRDEDDMPDAKAA